MTTKTPKPDVEWVMNHLRTIQRETDYAMAFTIESFESLIADNARLRVENERLKVEVKQRRKAMGAMSERSPEYPHDITKEFEPK